MNITKTQSDVHFPDSGNNFIAVQRTDSFPGSSAGTIREHLQMLYPALKTASIPGYLRCTPEVVSQLLDCWMPYGMMQIVVRAIYVVARQFNLDPLRLLAFLNGEIPGLVPVARKVTPTAFPMLNKTRSPRLMMPRGFRQAHANQANVSAYASAAPSQRQAPIVITYKTQRKLRRDMASHSDAPVEPSIVQKSPLPGARRGL